MLAILLNGDFYLLIFFLSCLICLALFISALLPFSQVLHYVLLSAVHIAIGGI